MVFCFEKKSGFTVLELIVALASLLILALVIPTTLFNQTVSLKYDTNEYINSQKLKAALLKSDLKRSQIQIEQYKQKYNLYPTTNRCDFSESNQNICLTSEQGSHYYYKYSQINNSYQLQVFRTDLDYLFELNSVSGDIIPKKIITLTTLSVSDGATCAISSYDDISCSGNYWQYDNYGVGRAVSNSIQTAVNMNIFNTNEVSKISNSNDHSCAIFSEQKVYCWGNNDKYQLGSGNSTTDPSLYLMTKQSSGYLNSSISQIDVDGKNTCAVDMNGSGFCWGDNSFGQVGNGSSQTTIRTPTKVMIIGKSFSQIKTASHSCGLTTDGQLYCWGSNKYGQIGDGTIKNKNTPVLISNLGDLSGKKVTKFDVSDNHSCALTDESKIYCWGLNSSGQLGDKTNQNSIVPTEISLPAGLEKQNFKDLAIDENISCGLSGRNTTYCWGDNSKMQLGENNVSKTNTPLKAYSDMYFTSAIFKSIHVSSDHICLLDSKNYSYCWGDNSAGQLGDGTLIDSKRPLIMAPRSL